MGRRKPKTRRWLEKQRNDGFVRQAVQQGYRSRATFKLQEIDERSRILCKGQRVLELGAAPGGWSQYVRKKVGSKGFVLAVDRLPMDPIDNVTFIHGDFTEPRVREELLARLEDPVDLVLSDIAPNITGIKDVDQAHFLELLDSVLGITGQVLCRGGSLLVKVFEGPETKCFRARCKSMFESVEVRKPSASRSGSREYYVLAKGLLQSTDK